MKYYTSKDDKTDYSSARFLCVNAVGLQKHTLFDTTVERTQGRSDYHVLYVKGGSCTAFFHGKEERLTAGDFILYPPHVPHKYVFLAKDACESYWLHFSGSCAEEILKEASLSAGIHHAPLSDGISEQLRDMINKYLSGESPLSQSGALCSLLSRLGLHLGGKEEKSALSSVLFAMAEDLSLPYDAARYAALCSLSESRFAHKCKEELGISPLGYFIRLKLSRAKDLLLSTELTVGEIAQSLGFDNPLYFSRLFKKHEGVSPLTYKKQNQSGKDSI